MVFHQSQNLRCHGNAPQGRANASVCLSNSGRQCPVAVKDELGIRPPILGLASITETVTSHESVIRAGTSPTVLLCPRRGGAANRGCLPQASWCRLAAILPQTADIAWSK